MYILDLAKAIWDVYVGFMDIWSEFLKIHNYIIII